MSQRLVPILVFFAVIAIGGAVILVRGWRRGMLEARLYGGGTTGGGGTFGATANVAPTQPSHRFVSTVEQLGRAVSNGKQEHGLREWLAQAGYYEDAAPTIYVGAQLVLGQLALAIGG